MGSHTAILELRNSILWRNTALFAPEIRGTADVEYTNITGGFPGIGNINVSPNLTGALTPAPGSPCIDAGDGTQVALDLTDLDGDGNFAEFTPLDIRFQPRFIDDPATVDTGIGFPNVDMGAAEYVP